MTTTGHGQFIAVAPEGDAFRVTEYSTSGGTVWSKSVSFAARGATQATPSAISVLDNGDILIAGDIYNGSTYSFAAARLRSNGTSDPTFGGAGDGLAVTPFTGVSARANAVAVDAQTGSITLAGFAGSNLGVVRYRADGTLDSTFGTGGKRVIDLGGSADIAYGVTIDPQGNLIVTGRKDADLAVLRLHGSDGGFDTLFGDGHNGKEIVTLTGESNFAYATAIDSLGRIVVSGETTPGGDVAQLVLLRLLSNGQLDTSFDTDGKWIASYQHIAGYLRSVAIAPDDKIVFAGGVGTWATGSESPKIILGRLNTNGSFDSTFGNAGVVVHDLPDDGPGDAWSTTLLRDDAGNWLVSQAISGSTSWMPIWSYLPGNAVNVVASTFASPQNLIVTAATTSGVALSWSSLATTNEEFLELYRSADDARTFTRIATLGRTVTSYTDTSVATGKTYHYRLMSASGSNRSFPAIAVADVPSAFATQTTAPAVSANSSHTFSGSTQNLPTNGIVEAWLDDNADGTYDHRADFYPGDGQIDLPGNFTAAQSVSVKTKTRGASLSASQTSSATAATASSALPPLGGLTATFYPTPNLQGTGQTVEPQNRQRFFYNWGTAAPAGTTSIPADGFSALFSGQIEPAFSEDYTFYTVADGGVRLTIDGHTLIDQWQDVANLDGDADRNGFVDASDYAAVYSHLGQTNKTWADGDFNGDHTVDVNDLYILERNFGKAQAPRETPAATDNSNTKNRAVIHLEAGKRYDISIQYYDASAFASLRLDWQSASQARETVPTSRLFSTSLGASAPSGSPVTITGPSTGQIRQATTLHAALAGGDTSTKYFWSITKVDWQSHETIFATGSGKDFSFTPDDQTPSTYRATVTAVDGGNRVTSAPYAVEVTNTAPPVTISGPPVSVEGHAVVFRGQFYLDEDEYAPTFTWSVNRVGGTFSLPLTVDPHLHTLKFVPDAVGTYTISLDVHVMTGKDFVVTGTLTVGAPTTDNTVQTVETNVDDYQDGARAVAVQPDGKVVIVGFSAFHDFAILRYNRDLTLDTTFGEDDPAVTGQRKGYVVMNVPDVQRAATGW